MQNHPSNSKLYVNLKNLPPIDPFQIAKASSKGILKSSCCTASPKFINSNPNHNQRFKVVSNPNFEDASSKKNKKKYKKNKRMITKKGNSKSKLYEICASKHWKPPIFECCKEEGPIHQKMFTFKVIIETEETPKNIIECYGAPHSKKKAAADHAAEGVLWYLEHLGCVMKP